MLSFSMNLNVNFSLHLLEALKNIDTNNINMDKSVHKNLQTKLILRFMIKNVMD